MVKQARNLKEIRGYGSYPDTKIGHKISNETLETVKKFYLTDNVSRVMPGMKDLKSFRENGSERQKESVSVQI